MLSKVVYSTSLIALASAVKITNPDIPATVAQKLPEEVLGVKAPSPIKTTAAQSALDDANLNAYCVRW